MKPYFAKYLPVEGEIKRGNKYLHSNGNIQQLADNVQLSLLSEINKTGKLVKLFLCSRDIQVGDKVRYGDNPTAPEHEVEALTECTTNECWKVIGEISPEAIWVKEGNEFDEDEIQRMVCISNPFGEGSWHKKPLNFKSQLNIRNEYGYTYINDRIEIKCPVCKKFH